MSETPALLVVDDEDVVCHACQRIFTRHGFRVDVNTDPRVGLTWATDRPYAAILLDIKMPLLDGLRFLELLRSKKPELPVVVITGYPNTLNADSAHRLGAADYVPKPFTVEEITAAVRRALAARLAAGRRADNSQTS